MIMYRIRARARVLAGVNVHLHHPLIITTKPQERRPTPSVISHL